MPGDEVFDWADRVSVNLTNMLATLFDFPFEDRMKHVNSPDAVVHSEAERAAELMKMGEYFRKLWDARIDGAPTFDLISMVAHSDATSVHAEPAAFRFTHTCATGSQ